jgi:hypothetical protein
VWDLVCLGEDEYVDEFFCAPPCIAVVRKQSLRVFVASPSCEAVFIVSDPVRVLIYVFSPEVEHVARVAPVFRPEPGQEDVEGSVRGIVDLDALDAWVLEDGGETGAFWVKSRRRAVKVSVLLL